MKKILIFLPIFLIASAVRVEVNKQKIKSGEDLVITIIVKGKKVSFPKIDKIAEFKIIGTSISNNIIIINGKIKETISKSYVIRPDRNFTIPSFSILVNEKVYKTRPIKIIVKD